MTSVNSTTYVTGLSGTSFLLTEQIVYLGGSELDVMLITGSSESGDLPTLFGGVDRFSAQPAPTNGVVCSVSSQNHLKAAPASATQEISI